METNDSISTSQDTLQEEEDLMRKSQSFYNPLSTQDILQKYLDFAPSINIGFIEPLLKNVYEQMKFSITNRKPTHSLEKAYPDILKRLLCTFCFLRQISKALPHDFLEINFNRFLQLYLMLIKQFPETTLTYIREDSDLSSFLNELLRKCPEGKKEEGIKSNKIALSREVLCIEWMISDIIENCIDFEGSEKNENEVIEFFGVLEIIMLCQMKDKKDLEMKFVNKFCVGFLKTLKQVIRNSMKNDENNHIQKSMPVEFYFRMMFVNVYKINGDEENNGNQRKISFTVDEKFSKLVSRSPGEINLANGIVMNRIATQLLEEFDAEVIVDENLNNKESVIKFIEDILQVIFLFIKEII